MGKVKLDDTDMDAILKVAGGNPGAIMAIAEILNNSVAIDPQNVLGGLGLVLVLDEWEIYGTDIYILFNDKCNRDVRQMLMMMRAVQLGFLPLAKLKEMASDQMMKVNLTDDEWEELDKKVCDRLDGFMRPPGKVKKRG